MPPRRRLPVMAAGTGDCNNLVRSLKAGAVGVHIVGCNDDRFILKQSCADRLYLTPPVTTAEFESALLRLLDHEKINLVIPSGDGDVLAHSTLRDKLGSRCFLPQAQIIDLCQDKFKLTRLLAAWRVPVPATFAVTHLDKVGAIFKRLGRTRPLWCRVRAGSRSHGAAPVNTVRQARAWIRYWEEMRGIPAGRFTLSEYLPRARFHVHEPLARRPNGAGHHVREAILLRWRIAPVGRRQRGGTRGIACWRLLWLASRSLNGGCGSYSITSCSASALHRGDEGGFDRYRSSGETGRIRGPHH